jgi:hypothetical protein
VDLELALAAALAAELDWVLRKDIILIFYFSYHFTFTLVGCLGVV